MKKFTLSAIFALLFMAGTLNAQWVELTSGYSSYWIFYGMSFPPGQNDIGYVAGMYTTYDGDGVILKTEDAGATWTTILGGTLGTIDGLQAICFLDDDTGFAGGWNNYFIKTTDGGATWSDVTVGTGIWYFTDIEFWDADNGVAAAAMSGTDMPIFITDDGGDTWTQATSGISQGILDVTYADATTLYAVGTGGTINKSTDGGYNWTSVYQASGITFGVDFEGTSFGVVGGEDGEMLATTNGGSSWSSYATGYEHFWAAKAFTGDSAYLGGTDENMYKTLDGGATWTMFNSGTSSSASLYKYSFTANNTGFSSGSGGTILMLEAPLGADFTADATTVCSGSTVNFTDLSTGAISWSWTFEGGSPSSSTDQNPTVTYNTPGTYNVSLTVSDGVSSVTENKIDYISVLETPAKADTPDGDTEVCTSNYYTYETNIPDYTTGFEWVLTPAAAGTITWEDNFANFEADGTWTGTFTIKVRATNMCGDGEWSDELSCTLSTSPDEFNLEGGGSYCLGDDGVEITLDGSQSGIDYELFLDGTTTGIIVAGTGSELSFGLVTEEGYYEAYGSNTECSVSMTGQVQVSVSFPPLEPDTPSGPEAICDEATSDYESTGTGDADSYIWMISPEEAGTISGDGLNATVTWSSEFMGTAMISLSGVNDCGEGNPSESLEVSVGSPTPEIDGEATVCDFSSESYSVTENEGSAYTWVVSGGEITEGQGTYMVTVAWAGVGYGTITVEEETAGGCTGSSEEFETMIDDCTGIGEDSLLEEVSVYPNPATSQVNIGLNIEQGVKYTLTIYNTMGQLMYSINETGSSSQQKHIIQTSDFPKGLYIVSVQSKEASLWKGKFEKAN